MGRPRSAADGMCRIGRLWWPGACIQSGVQLATLAQSLHQIEAVTSRQRITELLARLFRTGPEDAAVLPYLLQGRLGPPYAAPDLGVDERRLAQAIAEATHQPLEQVWRQYQQRGDLGLVAEHFLPARGQPVTVQEAFHRFQAIAAATGPGAYERKIALLRDLLRQLGGLEARYLVRIAQGKLRLGVGDAAILDALSVACIGTTALRPDLEQAYSFCSDLGLVAQTLFVAGPEAVRQLRPAPGRPVLSALAERLPAPRDAIKKLGEVLVEPKYDGLRLQLHRDGERVWLFTRRLEDVTHAFPDLCRAALRQIRARRVILDGEAVGYIAATDSFLPFQQTVRRRRKHGVEEIELRFPLRYYVFDLLYLDHQDCTALPQAERSRRLAELIRPLPDGVIFVTPQLRTAEAAELERYFDEMVRRGLEGVLVKRPDAPYHAGARRFNWVKLKRGYQKTLADTFDVVVVGYDRGRGKRARFGIGSLLGAVYDPAHDRFRTVSRVGSGLSDEEWVQMRERLDAARTRTRPRRVDSVIEPDVWVEPTHVIEVIAGEITRSPLHTCGRVDSQPGYALRFPRVSRLRLDRRPEDATTEQEVIELYRLQQRRAHVA